MHSQKNLTNKNPRTVHEGNNFGLQHHCHIHTQRNKNSELLTNAKTGQQNLCHFLLAIRKQKVNGGISTRYGKVKIFSSYFPHLYSCMYCFLTCTSYFQTGMLIFGQVFCLEQKLNALFPKLEIMTCKAGNGTLCFNTEILSL